MGIAGSPYLPLALQDGQLAFIWQKASSCRSSFLKRYDEQIAAMGGDWRDACPAARLTHRPEKS
jgi:hypothetical protein